MKSLRRSLNGKEHQNSVHPHPPISGPISALPPISKPNEKTQPPKKVIRALDFYRPNAPQELGFGKGDFFHVVKDVDENSPWYEAHNPMTGARGLVPKHLFEEFNRANASMRASTYTRNSANLSMMIPPPAQKSIQSPTSPRLKTFFAVVIHDFQAERPDELDAQAGENISVVAQSNREWLVAKPIGKLGRPGLIPVSFVELKDPVTGQNIPDEEVAAIMERGEIPRVEEWKKAMVAYKAASIPLGVIDDSTVVPVPNSPYMRVAKSGESHVSEGPDRDIGRTNGKSTPTAGLSGSSQESDSTLSPDAEQDSYQPLPFGALLSARVVSFHFENDEYWFRVHADWQPLDPQTLRPSAEEPLRRLILFRVYDDFYDFQIALLDSFPKEAGREPDSTTESGSSTRVLPYMPGPVEQVDDIVTSLRQDELDQYLGQLCGLARIGADYILQDELIRRFFSCRSGDLESLLESGLPPAPDSGKIYKPTPNVLETFGKLSVTQDQQALHAHESEGSDYGYDEQDTKREASSYYNDSYAGPRQPNADRPIDTAAGRSNRVTTDDYSAPHDNYNDQDYPTESGASSKSNPSRARSNSSANNPPISTTNAQTAFIKIKIFDRTSDDLIAIRVSPRVSHRQLMEKVRERLGSEVGRLNFRNSLNTGFVPLMNDEDLQMWLIQTDKHVLYAE